MKIRLSVLVCIISLARARPDANPDPNAKANPEANPAPSSEFIEKLATIVVNEENRVALGNLSLGTQLVLDQRTKLYRPPPLSRTFTPEDRVYLTWNNKKSRDNFCKEGPDRLDPANIKWNYFWSEYCRSHNGQDICCGDSVCSCSKAIWVRFNCACLPPKDNEAFIKRQKEDFESAKEVADVIGKAAERVATVAATVGKG